MGRRGEGAPIDAQSACSASEWAIIAATYCVPVMSVNRLNMTSNDLLFPDRPPASTAHMLALLCVEQGAAHDPPFFSSPVVPILITASRRLARRLHAQHRRLPSLSAAFAIDVVHVA